MPFLLIPLIFLIACLYHNPTEKWFFTEIIPYKWCFAVLSLGLADKILIFKAGVLQQYDNPHNMYCEPINCYCAKILGDLNKIEIDNKIYYIRPEKLQIVKPDDWHVHFREDEMLKVVTKYSSRVNRRCIAMPNTSKPITSSDQASAYKKLIESNSYSENFEALIPCYLTDSLNLNDFKFALQNNIFVGGN